MNRIDNEVLNTLGNHDPHNFNCAKIRNELWDVVKDLDGDNYHKLQILESSLNRILEGLE